MFVSPLETLSKLFEMPSFREEFFKIHHVCMPGIFKGFCCGSNYASNPFFQEGKTRARLSIYADEVELSNPLKANAGIHKLYKFYLIIDNLHPSIQSQSVNIKLLASCYSADLKQGN